MLAYNPTVINSLPDHFLMNIMFHSADDYDLADAYTATLKDIIDIARTPEENPAFFEYLGRNIFTQILEAQKYVEDSEFSTAEQYITMIVDFSRKAVRIFINKFEQGESFLNILLELLGNELLEVYDELLDFWEVFVDELKVVKAKTELSQPIKVMLCVLLERLWQRCRYINRYLEALNTRPESKLGELNEDGRTIHERREKTEDLFEKISEVFGCETFLEAVTMKMQQLNKEDQNMWSYLEVYLFSFVKPAKQMPMITPNIEFLMSSYHSAASNPALGCPLMVKKTFLKLFRSLMEIKEKTVPQVQQLFYFVHTGFATPLLMDTAERAFCKGCEINHLYIKDNIPDLITVLQNYPSREFIARGITLVLVNYSDLFETYMPTVLNLLLLNL